MESQFNAHTVSEIFRDLFLSERSGVLSLVRNGVEKRVHFERGLIYFAESTEEGEELGARLVGEGKLASGGIEEALESVDDPRDLAWALLRRDLVSRESMEETVRGLIGSVVPSVFRWDGGSVRFLEQEPLAVVFECDVVRTVETIMSGVFALRGFDKIREAMVAVDNRLRIRKPTPVPLERLTLSPAHGFILSRIDGSTTIGEVQSLLPPAEEEAGLKFLFGLLVLGVLEFEPPLGHGPFRLANILRDHADRRALEGMQEQTIRQAHEQMRSQTPYQILGVTPSCSPTAIERAYEEAKALFSRDRLLPKVREQYRAELAVIESRLIEAYLTLTRPESAASDPPEEPVEERPVGVDDLLVRMEMDKAKSKVAREEAGRVADSYYGKAQKAIREGDFHNAIQYGKLAISHNKDDARYYALLAECQVRNPEPRWQRMAEQNYSRATELDPWNVDHWISLGRFYKQRGLKIRARKQFEEALKIAPNHSVASRELETVAK